MMLTLAEFCYDRGNASLREATMAKWATVAIFAIIVGFALAPIDTGAVLHNIITGIRDAFQGLGLH